MYSSGAQVKFNAQLCRSHTQPIQIIFHNSFSRPRAFELKNSIFQLFGYRLRIYPPKNHNYHVLAKSLLITLAARHFALETRP
jgi:hypothetical protein